MALVNITINGQKLQCQAGQTVLQVARANGIDIPTLCDHPAVTPWGGCRMCLVEIEKQRGLQPACTFPVSEGMVVTTHSDRVVAARKFVLELLFSERMHYCMYCAMSGNEGTTAVRAPGAGLRARPDPLALRARTPAIRGRSTARASTSSWITAAASSAAAASAPATRSRPITPWACASAARRRWSSPTSTCRWASPAACRAAPACRSARPAR